MNLLNVNQNSKSNSNNIRNKINTTIIIKEIIIIVTRIITKGNTDSSNLNMLICLTLLRKRKTVILRIKLTTCMIKCSNILIIIVKVIKVIVGVVSAIYSARMRNSSLIDSRKRKECHYMRAICKEGINRKVASIF